MQDKIQVLKSESTIQANTNSNYATKQELNTEVRARTNGDKSLMNSISLLTKEFDANKKITEENFPLKQEKNDENLTTNDKTVVGSINELKTTNDTQEIKIKQNINAIEKNTNEIEKTTNIIKENTNAITEIQESYIKTTDINSKFDKKQNKNDENLTTKDKSVVGAINEIKTLNEAQVRKNDANSEAINKNITEIKQTNNNLNQNTIAIAEIKSDYLKASEASSKFDTKQNKIDDTLITEKKTIVGSINELKSINDSQKIIFADIENELNAIKEDYQKIEANENSLETKQDKIDSTLTTNEKNVIGAINELVSNIQSQELLIKNIKEQLKTTITDKNQNITNIQENSETIKKNCNNIDENKNSINEIKEKYLKNEDANNKFDEKQSKNDENLVTEEKTIVGAINELNTNISSFQRQISENNSNSTQNTNEINLIKSDYLKISDANEKFNEKQQIIDSNLATNDKTVVGAINELKTTNDNQTTNINEIKKNYLTISDANEKFNEKQNTSDENLTTNDQNIIGAINELNFNKMGTFEFETFQEMFHQFQKLTEDSLENKQNSKDMKLGTREKTIVGAINELKTTNDNQLKTITENNDTIKELKIKTANNFAGIVVGKSENPRLWSYNLKINKKYRIAFHWNSSTDTTSKIYKEFKWIGTELPLETYVRGFTGIKVLGIQVLGSMDVIEIIANKSGIRMENKIGSSSYGRIISLEELS